MGKIDLRKVASDVLDEMTRQEKEMLNEHDRRYHDGRYRGGKCKYRDEFDKADRLEWNLDAANDYEAKVYSGRRFEKELIENSFSEAFHVDQKKGMRRMFLEPDKDGNNQMEIICRKDTPDSFLNEDDVRKFFTKNGFEFKGMTVGEEKVNFDRDPKKVFRIDVYRPEKFEMAKNDRSEVGEVVGVSEGPMSEAGKNAALKRYGFKSEGGGVKKRDADDTRRDRAKKYMGMIGDWEGQSTREDAESDVWEKRRLDSIKRARDTPKDE